MTEEEARAILVQPKWAEPAEQWQQTPTRPWEQVLSFGVLDGQSRRMRGLHIEFAVRRPKRLAVPAWKLTSFGPDGFRKQRVYQIDNPGLVGVRPGDHEFPHEHVLDARQLPDREEWRNIGFPAMREHFCERCTPVLTGPVSDPQAFQLTQ